MENPEIDPHIYGKSILDKNVKSIQCGNRKCFLTNDARISGYPHRKGKDINSFLIPYQRVNFKW